jgi:hypothetical protein
MKNDWIKKFNQRRQKQPHMIPRWPLMGRQKTNPIGFHEDRKNVKGLLVFFIKIDKSLHLPMTKHHFG